jgi:glycosyltransferase involved in cell wall biosynthesis
MRLSVVIPVYNEERTVQQLLEKVLAVPIEKEIIVVNDCSTDNTADVLEKYAVEGKIRLFHHMKNFGKGAAIRTGIQNVTGDVVIIQDADLEYNPAEYDKLLKPILDGRADAVYGSRFLGSEEHRVLYFWHYVGNKFLTLLSNMFTNLNLTDMETCYKMVKASVLKKFTIEENRFGFEPEITAKLAKTGCRIYEVGISYSGRDYSQGKKIGWKDGFFALWCIVKYSLFSRVEK